MTITTRLTGVNKDFEIFLKEDLSPQARSAVLASVARAGLAEAQEINRKALGRIPPHETIVDSRRGGDIDTVKPDGTIVVEFDLLDDLFEWIGEQLVVHAPFVTGEYQRSFAFFVDGVELEPGAPLPEFREAVFLSTVPYARKIERGHSDQAPNGVFEVVAALAKNRFGNMANIRFSYRSTLLDYVALGGRKGGKTASAAKRSAHRMETESRTPAIIVSLR